ncbi:MAG TPA: ATPase, T2SS/T4P/T4SS family [bacterium]|nr:ATPase, T2SS/T4P/T4SS family [bacterium]HPL95682.1 ATPase, T2SS/T4P/T4SS family [bacterium]
MTALDKIQFENLLTQIVEQGGSDLYLSAGSLPMVKIINDLRPIGEEILTGLKIEELILPLLTVEQKSFLVANKALIFGHTFDNGLRFKINLFYQKDSLAADLHWVMANIKNFKQLGLPLAAEGLTQLNKGLVAITGPYQAGKTTTVMSWLEEINNNQEVKIITLEEPIEYVLVSKKSIVQQREIGKDTPSFAAGLKDCLESNAEVIMVSRLENKEEMILALELAEQGRLVIVITSADSVVTTLMKFLSFFKEEEKQHYQEILARTLGAVVCQRLVKARNNNFVLAVELLWQNETVRLCIEDNKLNQINNVLRTSAGQGMISLEQSLINLVKEGQVSLEEAVKLVEDKDGFLRRAGEN